jgi:hypothetical protein
MELAAYRVVENFLCAADIEATHQELEVLEMTSLCGAGENRRAVILRMISARDSS